MAKVVDGCIEDLKKMFHDGLEERCQVGAANAEAAALESSDAFAASMHWATYRASKQVLCVFILAHFPKLFAATARGDVTSTPIWSHLSREKLLLLGRKYPSQTFSAPWRKRRT